MTSDSSGDGITLVVPVRNEAESISALIASIRDQSRPPDEVVFVDGGSTDGTPNIIRSITRNSDTFTVQLIEAGPATPGRGRNLGAAVARHPWIAFTDAGLRLKNDWLEQLVRARSCQRGASVIFGSYEPELTTFFDSCSVGAYVTPATLTADGYYRGPSVASMMIHSDAFQELGGFPDLRAAEDHIFFQTAANSDLRSTQAPKAVVYWQTPRTIGRTFRRFKTYSRQNALAGRQRSWHYGVLRIYSTGLLILLCLRGRQRPTLLALGPLLRAVHTLLGHRNQYGRAFALNPARVLGAAGIEIVVDAATIWGWAGATLSQTRRRY